MELNREGWLTELAKKVQPLFRKFHLDKKPYRVTCGWPCQGATSSTRRRVGECHSSKLSSGGLHEIFISPLIDNPLEVAGVLCHELAHVAAGIESAHGKWFTTVCISVGLVSGRPTSVMPGKLLNERLTRLIGPLGAYPHKALTVKLQQSKKQSTVKVLECPECGCRITISNKWLDQCGAPTCACGEVLSEREKP